MTDRARLLRLAAAAAAILIPLAIAAWARTIALQAAGDRPLEPDAAAFCRIASQPAGLYAASEREPLFIFLHRVPLHFSGGDCRAIRLQSFIFSLALCAALAVVGLRVFKSRLAAAAAPLIFALTPYAAYMAARGLREELFLFLALLFFDRVFAVAERPRLNLAASSLLGAGVVLTRETGFFFLAATCGLAFVKSWQAAGFKTTDRKALGRMALTGLVPLAVAAALAAPFFINQQRAFGEVFHISRRDATFWRNQEFRDRPGYGASAEIAADPYRGPMVSSFDYLFRLRSPAQALWGMARGYGRAVTFYYPEMLGRLWWLMVLALPGVYRLWKLKRWEWIGLGPLLLFPFSFILTLSVVGHQSVDPRFAFAGYPGLLLLIGAGLDLAFSYRRERLAQSLSAAT